MDRRSLLRRVAAGAAVPAVAMTGSVASPAGEAGRYEAGVDSVAGADLPLAREAMVRAAPRDAIPAITDPAFGSDWSGVGDDLVLSGGHRVVGVVREGRARAYPLPVLRWHEVVNDEFGGPLLVTYCPLCSSGVVAERRVGGLATTFGVSGLLWRANLVLYDDRTGSHWSQVAATAVRGPRTGERLALHPSTLTTWDGWRETHPDSEVLLPPPASGTVGGTRTRPYARNPYRRYSGSDRIPAVEGEFEDDRLNPKMPVVGVRHGGETKVYPLSVLKREVVVNDAVGGLPVVVGIGALNATMTAHVRRVDGETRTFRPDGPERMAAGGSTWAIPSGVALDGPHEGTELAPASELGQTFWFAWVHFEDAGATEIYGVEG